MEEPEIKGVARHYEFERKVGGVVGGWGAGGQGRGQSREPGEAAETRMFY